ncbi:Carnitine O-palmitoyltransferase 1 liver [Paragonimus heterotremus]|uniref:Carnitine O-palmitoyltransferase 1 liver n=1 Tax=Paragonimus heterotremus TaxID=100268 RepID=A0A8J4T9Y5_9TREM|nr:Carnitine O-palmitoyltransferase 1 liver [Paragonimus heterotremus]
MAEAHQAAFFSSSLKPDRSYKNVFLTASKSICRQYEQKIKRVKNKFYNRLYPTKPDSWPKLAIAVFITSVLGVDLSFGLIPRFETYLRSRSSMDSTKCAILGALFYSLFIWVSVALIQRYTLMFLYNYQQWIYEIHSGVSWKTKFWAMCVTIFKGRNPGLYSFQSALPRLPLPSVSDTIRRYLNSVEPLLDEKEFERTRQLATEFEVNEAAKLQRYLRLKRLWAYNYVSDWWEDYVYLHGRSPLAVNSNIYGLDTIVRHPTKIQAARAAQLIGATVNYMFLLLNETLEPVLVNNMVPLCMMQYERTIGTTRIPGVQADKLINCGSDTRHIVVLHRGRFYKVRLFHENRWLDEREIERAILGVTWYIWDVELPQFPLNFTTDRDCQMAAFFVCLDDEDYIPNILQDEEALDKYASSMLHGNGSNRWFDKSFNLIVGRNCVIGFNAEHSWSDAPVMGHLWEMVVVSKTNYDHNGHCRGRGNSALPHCRRLRWELSEQCIDAIRVSLGVVTKLINDVDQHMFPYRMYGKSFISSNRLSPDAYIQLALQLTYFRNMGRFCLTYEASMTRLFREGRTETVRSCTKASVAFVKAMENPDCTNALRLEKLRAASDYHQSLYRDAMTGKGIDRHLFCLYVVARHLGIESPFLQEAVRQPWQLSTSQTPHGQTSQVRNLPQFSDFVSMGGGFGPVSDTGYGVSYVISSENTTFFHISSKRSCPLTVSLTIATDRLLNPSTLLLL